MGLACGWRLARTGAEVTLLDPRAAGAGATGASLGALWPSSALNDRPLQQLHRQSLWRFEAFVQDISAYADMPISFSRLGHLEFLQNDKVAARAAEESAAACASWPVFGDALPQMEVVPLQWALQFQPGLAPLHTALRICRNTAQVHVPELVAALRAACIKSGAELREHQPLTALESTGEHITAARTAQETIPADAVLITAGAWSPLLSPILRHAASIRPVKGQGLALAPPPGFHLRTIVKSGPIYLVPWQTATRNEILVGSTTEPEAGYDEMPTDVAREALFAGACSLFPALEKSQLLRHWVGLRPQNPAKSHPPLMGPHPTCKNLFLCTGHYKTGIGMAPLVSDLVAKTILTGTPDPALVPFVPHENR